MQNKAAFDRTAEDLGNVLALEHVNTRVPDQRLATLFYVVGLGLTRDPYLMTGVTNMWVNVGRSQFHLPTGDPQVLRGHTGLVIPDQAALLERLESVSQSLQGTRFAYRAADNHIEATCPWGNRLRCFEPGPRFGRMQLGIPYVEIDVPRGAVAGINRFYAEVFGITGSTGEDAGGACARVPVGPDQSLVFRETDSVQPEFDGHHVAIYISDFSGPYTKLLARGLVSREDDQHQYRFQDIVDPASGRLLCTVEHEVRSLRHPLFARPLVNRNPAQSNRQFAPGHEEQSWAVPVGG